MILLTGVSGFIGRHLLTALIKRFGAEEILALTTSPVEHCSYLLHNHYDFDSDYFLRSGYPGIHTIVHAGAYTPKNGAEANDWIKCNGNIINTDKLLKANLPALRKIIYLSTLDIYESSGVITEESSIGPVSFYGHSKFYTEKMIGAWAGSSGDRLFQVLRIGHVYGPGEEAYQKLIPATITRLVKNLAPQVWGTGEEMRSFIYIKDVVEAIVNAIGLKGFSGPINIASSQAVPVINLVKELLRISGLDLSIQYISDQPKRRDLVFNNEKMKNLLSIKETSLTKGLKEEWDYMKDNG